MKRLPLFAAAILLGTLPLHTQNTTNDGCASLVACEDTANAKLASYVTVEEDPAHPQVTLCRGTSCHLEDISPTSAFVRKTFRGKAFNEISVDRGPLKLSLLPGIQFDQAFTLHLVVDTNPLRNPGPHTLFSIPVATPAGEVPGIWLGFNEHGQLILRRASSDFTPSRLNLPAYTEDRPWSFSTTELLTPPVGMMDVFAIFRQDGKLEINVFPRWETGDPEWYAHLFDMGAPVHHYPTQTTAGPPWLRPDNYAISNQQIQFGSVGETRLLSAHVYSAALLRNEMLGLVASTRRTLPTPTNLELNMSPCNSTLWVEKPIKTPCPKGR